MAPFSSPQGHAPQTLAALWFLVALAMVFIALRLYTRYRVIESVGMDDHLFNAAFILLVLYSGLITSSAFYGLGLRRDDVQDPWDRSLVLLLTNAGQTVVGLAVWLSKASLSLFLMRLFGSCGRKTRWAIKLPPILLGLVVVPALLAFWFECHPIYKLWSPLSDGTCGDTAMYFVIVASVVSFTCDFVYAALPWFVLRNNSMPPREKKVVLFSLSLGIFAGVCGIMRAVELPSMTAGEYMRDRQALLVWHAAELTVTMVAIGIPVCRPLWKQWVNRILTDPESAPAQAQAMPPAAPALRQPGQLCTIGGSDMPPAPSQEGYRARSSSDAFGATVRDSESTIDLIIQPVTSVTPIQPLQLKPFEPFEPFPPSPAFRPFPFAQPLQPLQKAREVLGIHDHRTGSWPLRSHYHDIKPP